MLRSTVHNLNLRSNYRAAARYTEPHHWYSCGNPDRPTVVLVHGFMAHAMTFRRVVEGLKPHYNIVIPDLPAHGRDPSFRDPMVGPSIDSMTGWLHEFLDHFDTPVHLVGHSLGATLSYMVASERDQVASLGLVNPGLRIPTSHWNRRVVEALPVAIAQLGANRLGLRLYEPFQWKRHRMDRAEVDAYIAPLKDRERLKFILETGADLLRTPDRSHLVRGNAQPTLVMWGARDDLMGVENALMLRERMPGSTVHVFEHAGHSPMEDSPEAFVETLHEFLQTTPL